LQFERYFIPCSHGPWCLGAIFRFVPFLVNSSLDVSVFSASPTFGTGILTLGFQTVVIPIREVGAPRSDSLSPFSQILVQYKYTSIFEIPRHRW
jgi:hypothetical protein